MNAMTGAFHSDIERIAPRLAPLLLALAWLTQAAPVAAGPSPDGGWQIRAGVFHVNAQLRDAGVPGAPGSGIELTRSTAPGITITRFFNEHFAVETLLALPVTVDMLASGSLSGAGKLGELQSGGPVLLAQWHWGEQSSRLRPYAGVGVHYAMFSHEHPTATAQALAGGPVDLEVSDDLAPVGQLGVAFTLRRNWSLNVSALWVAPRPSIRMSLPAATVTERAQVNAWLIALTAGWRF